MSQPSTHIPWLVTQSTRAILGEGPVWDDRAQTLYWVDIEAGELHYCREDGSGEHSLRIGQRMGCVALRQDQAGFIAGLEQSIAFITLNPLSIAVAARLDAHLPRHRCNDGKCDPEGRFWVGTYNEDENEATAWLFRFDTAGVLARTAGPFVCTNGPAFSPDGKRIYCVDSHGRAVYQYDISPGGDLSGRRMFKRFDEKDWGIPDGLTCDTEGCIWIAHWGGYRVSRFTPEGELLAIIRLPVAQPTSCAFGGKDLKRLFITSASAGLGCDSNSNGLAGAVFAVDLDVGGLPAARYRG